MAPRKPRLSPTERALRAIQRMSAGTAAGQVESASPARRQPDPRITQSQPAGGAGPWAATRIVAASDSAHPESADYVCDGTADQVEINSAIASLPARGGRVLLLEGTFTVSDSVVVGQDFVTLQGQASGYDGPTTSAVLGAVTRIKVAAGTNATFPIIWDGHLSSAPPHADNTNTYTTFGPAVLGVTIRDLCVFGDFLNQTESTSAYNHGLQFIGGECVIDNVAVEHCTGAGIVLMPNSEFSGIRNCYVFENLVDGIVFKHSDVGGFITNNFVIFNGYDQGAAYGDPIGSGVIVSNADSDCIIADNYITDNGGNGLLCLNSNQGLIVGNVLEGNGYGINADEADFLEFANLKLSRCARMSVLGNIIYNGGGGLIIEAGGYTGEVNYFTVVGNEIADNFGHGILLDEVSTSRISDNMVVRNAAQNRFSATTFDAIRVQGDSFELSIHGNVVRRWLTDAGTYGINLDASTHDNWIVMNDLRTSGWTASYNDSGTSNDDTSAGNLI